MKAMTAMVKAIIGVIGYSGTLNGLSISGKLRLNLMTDIIERIYRLSAPKQAMVMMSPVFPVNNATIPIREFTISALAGVLKRGLIFPRNAGANLTLPNS